MTPSRYATPAIALHWLMFALFIGLYWLGMTMPDLPLSPWKLRLYSWHKWAGVTAFLLLLARIAWRAGHPPPPLPAALPPWQRKAAHGMHHVLYLLMAAVPVSGWLMSSALGFQTVYFGVLPIPDLIDKNQELGEALKAVHAALSYGMAALVAAHAAAALKHHVADRDGVLASMIPALAPSSHKENP